MFLDQIITNY